jgi:hypothetical protein
MLAAWWTEWKAAVFTVLFLGAVLSGIIYYIHWESGVADARMARLDSLSIENKVLRAQAGRIDTVRVHDTTTVARLVQKTVVQGRAILPRATPAESSYVSSVDTLGEVARQADSVAQVEIDTLRAANDTLEKEVKVAEKPVPVRPLALYVGPEFSVNSHTWGGNAVGVFHIAGPIALVGNVDVFPTAKPVVSFELSLLWRLF